MRNLATIQKIEEIKPIEGADKIEASRVKGWWTVTKKNEFKVGNLCVFFEIDSLVPKIPAFSFLEKNGTKKVLVMGELNQPNFEVEGYRVKTIRLQKQISQGLALPLNLFPEIVGIDGESFPPIFCIGDDVSELLNVYKYENCIGASLSSEAKGNFPSYVSKTDEERIQNISEKTLESLIGKSFTLTEKVDGTSLTTIRKDEEFHVCSRNLSLKEPVDLANAKGVYWQETIRYDLQNKLPNNYAVQGEIAGEGVQKNRLGLIGRDLYVFYVYDIKLGMYLPIDEMELFCKDFGLKTVPIIEKNWILTPSITRNDIIKFADGASLLNPKALREGVVWRLNGTESKFSFKAISNEYLLKWGE